MEKWKTDRSETLLDTEWVKVCKDSVRLPNGQEIDDFYTVTAKIAIPAPSARDLSTTFTH